MDTTFTQLLFGNWIVAIVLITVGAGVITSIAKQIRKYGCHRQEVELKRDLVERGLTVDEIERIIAARSPAATTSTDDDGLTCRIKYVNQGEATPDGGSGR